MSNAALSLSGIERTFVQGERRLQVLRGIDLQLQRGEIVALVGSSGSGKSTMLHIAGLLERPDAGAVTIAGQECGHLNDAERTHVRRDHLGFVYQFHHLLPEFTALENVALPQRIAGRSKSEALAHAGELLRELGLADRVSHMPAQLSGGEQQRVAIARAIANNPHLLLADEPTGNLDEGTAELVFQELLGLVRNQGLAALIATHNETLAARMDRTVRLTGGRLE